VAKRMVAGAFPSLIWLSIGLAMFAAVAIALTICGLRADAFDAAAREQGDLAIVLGREISASNRAVDAILDDVATIVDETHPRNPTEFRQFLSTETVGKRVGILAGG
jgi:hypothetical protein